MTAKFKRLMGIKNDPSEGGKNLGIKRKGRNICVKTRSFDKPQKCWLSLQLLLELNIHSFFFCYGWLGAGPSQVVEDRQPESSVDVLKKQQELFASLDQQYQVARATTHTQRGLGLGFGSSNASYPRWCYTDNKNALSYFRTSLAPEIATQITTKNRSKSAIRPSTEYSWRVLCVFNNFLSSKVNCIIQKFWTICITFILLIYLQPKTPFNWRKTQDNET